MIKRSLTVHDSSSNKSTELDLIEGTMGRQAVDITRLSSDLKYYTFDPGFVSTASCKSSITFIDGDAGILLYRGYPIEHLAKQSTFLEVAYLLINGQLPKSNELVLFDDEVKRHSNLHEKLRIFVDGFHYDAHPMAMMVGIVGSLSAFYHSELNMKDPEHRRTSALRMLAKMPTIAAACYKHTIGEPFVYPRTDLGYCENFLNMMFSRPSVQFYIGKESYLEPVASKALDLLFILHADHEQNASTSTVRLASSTGANPYACIAAGIAALWGPSHGGANEAVLKMLAEIGDVKRIPKFVARAKDKADPFRLMGFGHRVYKNFDPRATIIRESCHELLETLDYHDPLFDLALELENIALNDDYFIEKKLYPNVDFYSGIIYRALNLPEDMFTVMFTIARTAGWVSHWLEMMDDPAKRIGRPRQLYTGALKRDYVHIDDR